MSPKIVALLWLSEVVEVLFGVHSWAEMHLNYISRVDTPETSGEISTLACPNVRACACMRVCEGRRGRPASATGSALRQQGQTVSWGGGG